MSKPKKIRRKAILDEHTKQGRCFGVQYSVQSGTCFLCIRKDECERKMLGKPKPIKRRAVLPGKLDQPACFGKKFLIGSVVCKRCDRSGACLGVLTGKPVNDLSQPKKSKPIQRKAIMVYGMFDPPCFGKKHLAKSSICGRCLRQKTCKEVLTGKQPMPKGPPEKSSIYRRAYLDTTEKKKPPKCHGKFFSNNSDACVERCILWGSCEVATEAEKPKPEKPEMSRTASQAAGTPVCPFYLKGWVKGHEQCNQCWGNGECCSATTKSRCSECETKDKQIGEALERMPRLVNERDTAQHDLRIAKENLNEMHRECLSANERRHEAIESEREIRAKLLKHSERWNRMARIFGVLIKYIDMHHSVLPFNASIRLFALTEEFGLELKFKEDIDPNYIGPDKL